eukprot:TRINITY_DN1265_c0_g1_i4.p2 TRINITY_DN1265_c0_g1~~TRINITY_DN1265_c0_g1_i4.p2  ORF type:complete len:188 (+),score=54.25 TRINITY_DN1265_c0_g1_i4:648-1211(+)
MARSGAPPGSPRRRRRSWPTWLATGPARAPTCLRTTQKLEEKSGERVVCGNTTFLAVVPFWAVWPFEVLVLSKKRIPSMNAFGDQEKDDLADIYRRVTCRYDNLFTTLFPYSMGIHQAPTDGSGLDDAHFHMHFYPPLLRSATVRKFMVGFELLAEAQRDLTAEQAAQRLRDCSEVHFNDAKKKEDK